MCGIAGVALSDPRRPGDLDLVRRMASTLRHRGPDGLGLHAGPGVGLGVQRLAIVDLETGDQPLASEDGAVVAVCNGEIYNHVELRRALGARGHRFRSRSDVEVIVHLYEEDGIECVARLRGMFAFALWDGARRRLWLVRDRLGIKPLHYAITPEGLLFASEMKAILAAGADPGAPDVRALDDVFRFGFVREPATLFAGIRRLSPGHWLLFEDGHALRRPYWRLADVLAREPQGEGPAGAWAERLRAKLEETVALHLQADVPVGAWLSSGVDSSAIAALAARLGGPLRTFTLAVAAPGFDETRGRALLPGVSDRALPNERVVCDATALERFPEAMWHTEAPVAATADLPRLLLAEATARQVRVALTGEGGDEVFGGYAWQRADRLLHGVSALPLWLRRGLLLGRVGPRQWPWGSRIVLAPRAVDLPRYACFVGPLGGEGRHALFSPAVRAELEAAGVRDGEPGIDWPRPGGRFRVLQCHDLGTRLPGYVTESLDRTTMAFGLEARVPFLDHELVELVGQIPPRLHLRGLREKYLLRQAVSGDLPPAIAWRRKQPLRGPVGAWLRGPLPEFAEALLSAAHLRADGYFDPPAVHALLARHRGDPRSDGHLLWAVLGVQLWHDLFRRAGGRWAERPARRAAGVERARA